MQIVIIFRENANVNPSSTGAVNHYELDENEESSVEINTHEAVNTSGTSATTNNAPENTSANDNNKEIKSVNILILRNDGFHLEKFSLIQSRR